MVTGRGMIFICSAVIMTLNLTIKTQERRCLILKNIDMLVNMVRYILPTNNELHGVKESKYYDGRIDTEKIESCPFYCLTLEKCIWQV